jgi:hypothetical protein
VGYEYNDKVDKLIDAAKDALSRGKKNTAREHLEQVLDDNELHEEAWFLMFHAVDSEEDKRTCLENALSLNPNHTEARAQLDLLSGTTGSSLFDGFDPFAEEKAEEEELPFDYEDAAEGGQLASLLANRRLLIALMALFGLGFVCMTVLAVLLTTWAI